VLLLERFETEFAEGAGVEMSWNRFRREIMVICR